MNADVEEFAFFKGRDNVLAAKEGQEFKWAEAEQLVSSNLSEAMSARHLAFLFGSGCSSHYSDGIEVGIPTMGPMAKSYLGKIGEKEDSPHITQVERDVLGKTFGIDVAKAEFSKNLEKLMEVLYSLQFVLRNNSHDDIKGHKKTVVRIISKISRHILTVCSTGKFAEGDSTVLNFYRSFYQKLMFRDRSLPRPWIFTTNYDLFNEMAMDRLSIPYSNGFSGSVERRFNPATFRYTLAEQLDITNRRWSAVDGFNYLCKLHGSVNWIEEPEGLFPIRELQSVPSDKAKRVLIYPTPAKQNASLGSPYSNLFREFQKQVVRDQSVLIVELQIPDVKPGSDVLK